MSDQPKQTNADEIDMGQLFQYIGNGIKSVFAAIGRFLMGIVNALLWLVLLIRKNVILLGLIFIIAAVGGYFLDQTLPKNYISKMVVEPNFNSAQQLYNSIEFYNNLAETEDSITLGAALQIEATMAAKLKEIKVESFSDENQKLKLFDEFVRELDTLTAQNINIQEYLENFNSLDARFHQITVISESSSLAKKIQPAIISSIESNDYFKLQKAINDENIVLQDSVYQKQLTEIDNVLDLYQSVMLKEAENPSQGTTISLGEGGETTNREIELIQEREVLKNRLVYLNRERANKTYILNVISDFPLKGSELRGFWYRFMFLLPVVATGACLLFLIFLRFNKYLGELAIEKNAEKA
jgi:hypothetical protein